MPPPDSNTPSPDHGDHIGTRWALLEAKVGFLQDDVNGLKKQDLKTEIAVLKVKITMFSAIAGLIAGIAGSIVTGVILTWLGS